MLSHPHFPIHTHASLCAPHPHIVIASARRYHLVVETPLELEHRPEAGLPASLLVDTARHVCHGMVQRVNEMQATLIITNSQPLGLVIVQTARGYERKHCLAESDPVPSLQCHSQKAYSAHRG